MLNRNQVIQNSELSTSQDKKLNKKNRVDINILLNRVRLDKKRTIKKRFIFLPFDIKNLSLIPFCQSYADTINSLCFNFFEYS